MRAKPRSPDVRTLVKQIPAEARDLPDIVLLHLRPHARVVALWRHDDKHPGRWVYLERISAREFSLDEVIRRYGGGEYRAKILGQWDPARRCEEYLMQLTFAIDRCIPPTAAVVAKIDRSEPSGRRWWRCRRPCPAPGRCASSSSPPVAHVGTGRVWQALLRDRSRFSGS